VRSSGDARCTPIPQEWFDAGFVMKADTIEELAPKIGLDPKVLKNTVERFNADARLGKDTEFHRGERAYDKWLGDVVQKPNAAVAPVDTAPFYAARVVRANTIAPGHLHTAFVAPMFSPEQRMRRQNVAPLRTIEGTGWDVAAAALYLASDEARFISGTCIPVDGGVSQLAALPAVERMLP
jgi:hypothetical protein